MSKWHSLTNPERPENDFVWAHSRSQGVVLAYYMPANYYYLGFDERWQYAETVGDQEGLSTEYYNDVTHWRELA